ncbi:MAG: hypothetical protein ABEH47_05890 [Haloferacaceae archaeon]
MSGDEDDEESLLFIYATPFLGVLLIAVGIGAAVPGGYALIQEDITDCGDPTISVESPEATAERVAADGPRLERFAYDDLAPAERRAFESALADPVGEARVDGPFPHAEAFRNGSVVTYEGERHYVTVVAENPCFSAAPLQFPLGVFAIALGTVGVLTPPLYRRLVALEERVGPDREGE